MVNDGRHFFFLFSLELDRILRAVLANVLDYKIVGIEFELQLCYYVHFRIQYYSENY